MAGAITDSSPLSPHFSLSLSLSSFSPPFLFFSPLWWEGSNTLYVFMVDRLGRGSMDNPFVLIFKLRDFFTKLSQRVINCYK